MSRVERGVVEAARVVEDEATFRDVAPTFTIGHLAGALTPPAPAPAAPLSPSGYTRVPGVVAGARAAEMASAIHGLAARGLPTPFAYVWDAFWEPARTLLAWTSAHVGDYELVDDAWAWRVAPGSSGWPAHRGMYTRSADRDAPDVLNVWIALGDVTAEGGAMHAVGLDRDPAYPGALDDISSGASLAVALPAAAGDALVWDANVLHWGGAVSEASPPRVSFSYTLRRRGSGAAPEARAVEPGAMGFRARLDLIAAQLVTYGAYDTAVEGGFRDWARAVHGLSRLRAPRR